MTKRSEAGPSYKIHGKAYQGAMEAVFATPVGLGLGYLADRSFETDPALMLVGGGIGFAAFVLRLVRLGRELQPRGEEGESAEEPRDEK